MVAGPIAFAQGQSPSVRRKPPLHLTVKLFRFGSRLTEGRTSPPPIYNGPLRIGNAGVRNGSDAPQAIGPSTAIFDFGSGVEKKKRHGGCHALMLAQRAASEGPRVRFHKPIIGDYAAVGETGKESDGHALVECVA